MKNRIIITFVLSGLVLIVWWYFIDIPQQKHRPELQRQAQMTQAQPAPGGYSAAPAPGVTAEPKEREDVVASTPRIAIETPIVTGSVNLKGGRIDDVSLSHKTAMDRSSLAIVLLSPAGSPQPYYAEFGWVSVGATAKMPGPDTVWSQDGEGALAAGHPVTLRYDNGDGLEFRRTISVDDRYLFTLRDEVANHGAAAVSLHPYALISRRGMPPTPGSHDGLIGMMGDQGLQNITYKTIEDKRFHQFDVTNAWMGFTDEHRAAILLPDTTAHVQAEFHSVRLGPTTTYQAGYLLDRQTVAPGATGSADARLFAGNKEVGVVAGADGYNRQLGLNRFDLLINRGLLYFITEPLELLVDEISHRTGGRRP
jgi:YidC/Oxa1 family membrane protein insertase